MVTVKYFVDDSGVYMGGWERDEDLCGFSDLHEIYIEVPFPPPVHALQKWNGETWDPVPAEPLATEANPI